MNDRRRSGRASRSSLRRASRSSTSSSRPSRTRSRASRPSGGKSLLGGGPGALRPAPRPRERPGLAGRGAAHGAGSRPRRPPLARARCFGPRTLRSRGSSRRVVILVGWIVLETPSSAWSRGAAPTTSSSTSRGSSRRPLCRAAPLYPLLSRLVEREPEPEEPTPDAPETRGGEGRRRAGAPRRGARGRDPREARRGARLAGRRLRRPDRPGGHDAPPRHDRGRRGRAARARSPTSSSGRSTRGFPLVEGSVDKPVGIVHVKDVLTLLRSPDPPAHGAAPRAPGRLRPRDADDRDAADRLPAPPPASGHRGGRVRRGDGASSRWRTLWRSS